MPCYHPIELAPRATRLGGPRLVPCGRCIGCRLERSRQWAVRIMHEASLHPENSFLTLTYRDEDLPEHSSLDRTAIPRFMKRLRKATNAKIRYFQCGEYGENLGRPHYHLCLLGYSFPDETPHTQSGPHQLRTSDLLSDLWPHGHHQIGDLSFDSAAYVARYVTKKITGRQAESHYTRVDRATGELVELTPEHATMSRRPGIGYDWFQRYWRDVYPSDEIIVRGHPSKPPRYYDQLLEAQFPDIHRQVISAREKADPAEITYARLAAREECTHARLSLHGGRTYEAPDLRRP